MVEVVVVVVIDDVWLCVRRLHPRLQTKMATFTRYFHGCMCFRSGMVTVFSDFYGLTRPLSFHIVFRMKFVVFLMLLLLFGRLFSEP
jgi:hypothetical protein